MLAPLTLSAEHSSLWAQRSTRVRPKNQPTKKNVLPISVPACTRTHACAARTAYHKCVTRIYCVKFNMLMIRYRLRARVLACVCPRAADAPLALVLMRLGPHP